MKITYDIEHWHSSSGGTAVLLVSVTQVQGADDNLERQGQGKGTGTG